MTLVTAATIFALTFGGALSLKQLFEWFVEILANEKDKNKVENWRSASEALKSTIEALEARLRLAESLESRVQSLESQVEALKDQTLSDESIIRRLRSQRDRLLRLLRKFSTRLSEVESELKKMKEQHNASSTS